LLLKLRHLQDNKKRKSSDILSDAKKILSKTNLQFCAQKKGRAIIQKY